MSRLYKEQSATRARLAAVINEKGTTLSECKTSPTAVDNQEAPCEVDVDSGGHERDPVKQTSQASHSDDNQKARALDYIKRGWAPIPLPFLKEEPTRSDWRNLGITADNVDRYFTDEPANIGVVLGKASKNLVDVYFVDDDALRFADVIMPDTLAKFGLPSRPNSHSLYHAMEDEDGDIKWSLPWPSRKWRMKGIGTIVELRSEGLVSALPGSVVGRNTLFGEERETIVWQNDDCVFDVECDDLFDRISLLAMATVLFKQWNVTSKVTEQDDLMFSLATFMSAYSFTKHRARNLIRLIAKAFGEEDKFARFDTIVESVFASARSRACYSLEHRLGKEAARAFDNWREDMC